MRIRLLLILGVALLASSLWSAPELPVVNVAGSNYYMYTTRKDETLFGIARQFGWDDKKLQEFNPSAISPLRKGMRIFYPVSDEGQVLETPVNRDPVNVKGGKYTIRKGQTLYGVAKRNNVSVAAIMKLNPGISATNFKAGAVILLPPAGTGITQQIEKDTTVKVTSVTLVKAKKDDTWSSIASENGISADLLKKTNPKIHSVRNKGVIAVPALDTITTERTVMKGDPREVTDEGLNAIYGEVHGVNLDDSPVKMAVLLSSRGSKMETEFVRGVFAALDNLKRSGLKCNIKVIDENQSNSNVITRLDEFKPNVVLVGSEQGIPSYIADYAAVSLTPVVSAFDVKGNQYEDNAWLVQLLSPSTIFNENIASYSAKKWGDRILIFAGTEDPNDMLAQCLKDKWDAKKIRKVDISELKPDYFIEQNDYLVYSYPVKKEEVSSLVSKIADAREELPFINISVLGRPNLIVMEESMAENFGRAELYLPTRFYIDRESLEYRDFLNSYKTLFEREPVKSVPLYAAMGYDTAGYFLEQLSKSSGDLNKFRPSQRTVQSLFDFKRPENWSGFINPPVYMIRYGIGGYVTKDVVSGDE
ncbi:MAG: LysM peptidoglycan-binding domain-containing protein [Muribaculaceae bacterium]|nr:LysM peptidoglycan-binding domain-containing protein [Muribaculaceae bacterium]